MTIQLFRAEYSNSLRGNVKKTAATEKEIKYKKLREKW